MNDDYYTRLLPYILKFSREFLAHKKLMIHVQLSFLMAFLDVSLASVLLTLQDLN